MPGVQDDLHYSAHLVAAVQPLQLLLSAAVFGVEMPDQQLGAISSSLQGPRPIAGSSDASPLGLPETDESLVLGKFRTRSHGSAESIHRTHHPCLGLCGRRPYSAHGGRLSMKHPAAEILKQQIPLLDYLEGQDWKPVRRIAHGRLMGLCPLHADRKPSFLLDPNKNLFYCYGCGRGGDVIRFAELYHGVPFGEAISLLRRWSGVDSLLSDVIRFYQVQLHRHPEAAAYLLRRGVRQPELVEQMRIGYAPGRCLRAWLMSTGYALRDLQQAGVVTLKGFDAFAQRIVFPLDTNLYGRSIGKADPHRFLPGGKGGLYGWEKVRNCRQIVLVEGLFDWVAVWQAGFHNVTCSMGTCLNATQLRQLLDGASRAVYLAFDSDVNGAGQQAACRITQHLRAHGVEVFRVELPQGHDPNSFFVHGGGDACQFQILLRKASA